MGRPLRQSGTNVMGNGKLNLGLILLSRRFSLASTQEQNLRRFANCLIYWQLLAQLSKEKGRWCRFQRPPSYLGLRR